MLIQLNGSGYGLLMVTLGEFIWRGAQPVAVSTIITALKSLNVSENAARKAIHRARKADLIATERRGRESFCRLTSAANTLFEEGSNRVFGLFDNVEEWSGEWLILSVSVPESQRALRHKLQTRLQWNGFGSPSPGIWISPHPNRPLDKVLQEIGNVSHEMSFIGSFGPVGDERAMVHAAWDVDEIAQCYKDFLKQAKSLRPVGEEEVFRDFIKLIHAWRKFPFIDPVLPAQLLPQPWIGRTAAQFVKERRASWKPQAKNYWTAIQSG